MDAQLVHNLKCAIQNIVYKRAYHSQHGMNCKVLSPCLLANILFAIESECAIPDSIQCEIDKLNLTNYPIVSNTNTVNCNTNITVQQLPPLTPIIVELI